MEIYKIEKPDKGWDERFLMKYGFGFYQGEMSRRKLLIFFILSKNLPYFYYIEEQLEEYNTCFHSVCILQEYVDLIHQASIRNQFNSEILSTIIHFNTIQDKNEIISILTPQIAIYKQDLAEKKKKQQEQKIKKEQEKIKKEQEEIRKRNAILKIQEKQNFELVEDNGNGGIYGIYSIDGNNDKQLLYIGLTTRSFQERFNEHQKIIKQEEPIPKGMERLYLLLIEEYRKKYLEFKILIPFCELSSNRYLTQSEKEAMEML